MTQLLNPEDFPLKSPSKLFRYETLCRSIDSIKDKEILLILLRTALTKLSSSSINTSFLSEVIYREIENNSDISILKVLLSSLTRIALSIEENAQDTPSTSTNTH
jgi:hypothetical protein